MTSAAPRRPATTPGLLYIGLERPLIATTIARSPARQRKHLASTSTWHRLPGAIRISGARRPRDDIGTTLNNSSGLPPVTFRVYAEPPGQVDPRAARHGPRPREYTGRPAREGRTTTAPPVERCRNRRPKTRAENAGGRRHRAGALR